MAATSNEQWGRPAMSAGSVALLIYVIAVSFGGVEGRQHRGALPMPLPTHESRVEPATPTPAWPAPTSAPAPHVVVPWRELPPGYATIPNGVDAMTARFGGVVAQVSHVEPRQADDLWRFEVTLTAQTGDVPLDACPDFNVEAGRYDLLADSRFGLDCAGVPFRDEEGAPYLPLNRAVTFEFVATAPGAAELTWELLAPGGPRAVVRNRSF